VQRLLVGNPEGKRSLGTPSCRWADNIKTEIAEMEWGGGMWTGIVWLRIGTSGIGTKF
jgi:hypothetical protein